MRVRSNDADKVKLNGLIPENNLIGLSDRVEVREIAFKPENPIVVYDTETWQRVGGHDDRELGNRARFCFDSDTVEVVVSGHAAMQSFGREHQLTSGQYTHIPKGVGHDIVSFGNKPLLICSFHSPARSLHYEGRNGTEAVLLERKKINDYLEAQKIEGSPESELPIHIGTNLGLSREVYTAKSVLKRLGDVDLGFAACLEISVPSLDTIAKAYADIRWPAKDPYSAFLVDLDMAAQLRSDGKLRGNCRDLHGNVWSEIFVMLSGEMTYVQFDPTSTETAEMRENEGSLYSLESVDDVNARGFKNQTIERLKAGDVFYSPPGCAHGLFDADDAVYMVFIHKDESFGDWMKEFWGEGSRKYDLNVELAKQLAAGDTSNVKSHWTQCAETRKEP